jgi:hypothetical protein
MCDGGLVIAGLGVALSAAGAVSANNTAKTNRNMQQDQLNKQALQSYRSDQFSMDALMDSNERFNAEMGFKTDQMGFQSEAFNQEMAYKSLLLEQDVLSHEEQIRFDNAQNLADVELASKNMRSAREAEVIDMGLIGQQWTELTGAAKTDQFERKRQALKEQAQIRVSQGESGIFGNTALKELSNSVVQKSWDSGIIGWNLTNKGKQQESSIKKIKSTADSRVNESLSGVQRSLAGSMNGAVTGITIPTA